LSQFLQLLFTGVSLGSTYALIALGFSVVYRASRVINFAQGAMLLVGAYLISWLAVDVGQPFALAVALALVAVAAGAMLFQIVVLRRVGTRDIFAGVMITIGLSVALTAAIDAIFGPAPRLLVDPWRSSAVHVGAVTFTWVKIWGIVVALVLLAAFFAFDRYTRYGLAMRATAADQEAALSVGVPVRRIHALAWAVAGAVATVGGLFLAGFPSSPNPSLGDAALIAFPAIVLGGLESPVGAVVGGVVIGVVQVLTAGYAPGWMGSNVDSVAPYIVMIVVLLVRPYGLFGVRPAVRL
jgi:branched-chain amino acid transport system permease protein